MKIRETIRCCSFFLRTHVKISSKISIIEFNIQIKWCIIVTPSREAEKDYQGYFNSPPHKKNHIATTMINTVLFKISTHIFTRRMTATCTNTTVSNIISTHILTKRMTSFSQVPRRPSSKFQLTSSRRGWQPQPYIQDQPRNISTHILTKRMTSLVMWGIWEQQYFNSHPHEEDDRYMFRCVPLIPNISTHILTKRMTNVRLVLLCSRTFQLTSSRRGWPFAKKGTPKKWHISTHILTERMTQYRIQYRASSDISTHILTKRMTALSSVWLPVLCYFNSHPHEEDDNWP